MPWALPFSPARPLNSRHPRQTALKRSKVASQSPLQTATGDVFRSSRRIKAGAKPVATASLPQNGFPEPEESRLALYASVDPDTWDTLLRQTEENPWHQDPQGHTPLHYAAIINDWPTAQSLLKLGADVNHQGRRGDTPLMLACMQGHLHMARVLLNQGANANHGYQTPWPESPLVFAARAGNFALMKILLHAGVNRQHKNQALHSASRYGRLEEVRLLLRCGAEVDNLDKDGMTPLINALRTNRHHVQAVGALLLEHGANPNALNTVTNSNALFLASQHGLKKLAELLVEQGADREHRNYLGQTASDSIRLHKDPDWSALLSS